MTYEHWFSLSVFTLGGLGSLGMWLLTRSMAAKDRARDEMLADWKTWRASVNRRNEDNAERLNEMDRRYARQMAAVGRNFARIQEHCPAQLEVDD